jgi:osmoprotectant transport system substrate-binding protein
LNLQVLQKLNAEVAVNGADPRLVAMSFLDSLQP